MNKYKSLTIHLQIVQSLRNYQKLGYFGWHKQIINPFKHIHVYFMVCLFQLDTALQRIYNYLQRFAVGLEEVVLDQALFDGEFIQEFNEAEYKLKAVSWEN